MMFTGSEPLSDEGWEVVRQYWQTFYNSMLVYPAIREVNPSYECHILSYGPLT